MIPKGIYSYQRFYPSCGVETVGFGYCGNHMVVLGIYYIVERL